MNTSTIDVLVGTVLFVLGIGLTVRRFGTHNRLAFFIVAVLSPLVALFAIVRVALSGGRVRIGQCPDGLEEAERLVEVKRQEMFGGKLREPSYARSWKLAYERELQAETDRLQQFARKYFVVA